MRLTEKSDLLQVPQRKTFANTEQKSICTCPVMLIFVIAISVKKPLILALKNKVVLRQFFTRTVEKLNYSRPPGN